MKHEKKSHSFAQNVLLLVFVLGLVVAMACMYYLGPNLMGKRSEKIEVDVVLRRQALYSIKTDELRFILNGSVSQQCNLPSVNDRFDCLPGDGASQQVCEDRGCCWVPPPTQSNLRVGGVVKMEQRLNDGARPTNVPYCYFPLNYPGYIMDTPTPTEYGFHATLTRSTKSAFGNDVMNVTLEMYLETSTRLHFKLLDATQKRYEVPLDTPKVTKKVTNQDYGFEFTQQPFGLKVFRKSTGSILFDTNLPGSPLIYADQYLEISTRVPSGRIYGLGENEGPLLKNFTSWQDIGVWAHDQPIQPNVNLYGSHPFFLSIDDDGTAYGVFFLNSNAMDFILQPTPALTYRTIGGIFDFYIFTGPSPDAVVQQYLAVIGQPVMVPYWSLGFHLCRYNYSTSAELNKVVTRMRAGNFPYDTQWVDIDHMDAHLVWTYDKKAFATLPNIVQDLHDHHQHFVPIIDPGVFIGRPGNYKPYDDGMKRGVFIKNATGQPLVGVVWPGATVYPDFTHPDVGDWWYESASDFHKEIAFDGLWIDMNEPSNFVDGSQVGCTSSSLDNPPYTPGILGNSLHAKTICPSAQQHLSSHYNLHSLYGHLEGVATKAALERIFPNGRSFIISRSSFAGTGHFASHWTGDNTATWDALYYSVPAIINFQLFGIPFVGADICGFGGDTTPELCTRWMQLGAFYPFMRNHNSIGQKDQDPAVFDQVTQDRMRSALQLRYSLLPVLYTLLYESHVNGTAAIRPLVFQYPKDPNTYDIDRQFLWGDSLMISPVLQQGGTSVEAYFPDDTWYDFYTGKKMEVRGQWTKLDAPLGKINVHMRGYSVRITQPSEVTTAQARHNPFGMIIALCRLGEASGRLFWDDGLSRNSIDTGAYNLIQFNVKQGVLTSKVLNAGYKTAENSMMMNNITIFGISQHPNHFQVNGKDVPFTFNDQNKVLYAPGISPASLLQALTIKWT